MTQCSFSGRLTSDPESTVYISGCPEKEAVDISLMSEKVDCIKSVLLVVIIYLDLVLVLVILLLQCIAMDLFTMISFQSHLEYNTYRWDKTGKKLQVL